MILKRRVALNGVWLDEVDSRICISSVEPADGRESITAVDAASGYGQRITGIRRQTVDMVVKFRIHEKGRSEAGMRARSEVLEAVNSWAAGGGYLTVNYKPDRRLYVILAQAPGEGSLWDFSKEFQITFRAYGIPYWEQEAAQSVMFGGNATSGSRQIGISGSAKTQVNVELQNTDSAGMDTATITVGSDTMAFSSLSLAAGETLVIDHTESGLVRIRIRSTGGVYRSAMAKRVNISAGVPSANDFMQAPGTKTASYSAAKKCKMTVSWRARYL